MLMHNITNRLLASSKWPSLCVSVRDLCMTRYCGMALLQGLNLRVCCYTGQYQAVAFCKSRETAGKLPHTGSVPFPYSQLQSYRLCTGLPIPILFVLLRLSLSVPLYPCSPIILKTCRHGPSSGPPNDPDEDQCCAVTEKILGEEHNEMAACLTPPDSL